MGLPATPTDDGMTDSSRTPFSLSWRDRALAGKRQADQRRQLPYERDNEHDTSLA